MLLPEQLLDFFKKHNIPLNNSDLNLSNDQIYSIYLNAEKIDKGLSGFILFCITNPELTKIQTNFLSDDELYDSYLNFNHGLTNQISVKN